MLVAPSCHNVYLSPQSQQHKLNNASSSSASKNSGSSASSKSNIFKSAFNKSINFFSKIASSSGSPSTSTSASTSSKPPGSDNHESSSSETPSDCSSPDSLKIELGHFKPIIREPRTPSSTTNSKVFRVPTVRSVSASTDFVIHSPCPSPFFIPITPRRESAFSFVSANDEEKPQTLTKPVASKRKVSGPIKPPPKRTKKSAPTYCISPKMAKKKRSDAGSVVAKPKVETKTEDVRKTRSMGSQQVKDVDHRKPAPDVKVQQQKVFRAPPPKKAVRGTPKKKGQAPKCAPPAPVTRSLRTRMQH